MIAVQCNSYHRLQGQRTIDAAPEMLQADFLKQYRELQPWEANLLLSALQRLATMMHAEKLDVSPILAVGEIGEESGG